MNALPIPELRQLLADRTHLVEFHQDGWTVLHPMSERLDGSLLDCTVSFHHLDGPPSTLGLFYVTDEGEIGEPCAQQDIAPASNITAILDAAEAQHRWIVDQLDDPVLNMRLASVEEGMLLQTRWRELGGGQ